MRHTAFFLSFLIAAGCGPATNSIRLPYADLRAQSMASTHSRSQKLFVSATTAGYGSVLIFDYPSGGFVGQVPSPPEGLIAPAGMCKDSAGNVYVTNATEATIDEYSGQGSYLTTINDPQQEPVNCSVSSASGDLAVVNSVNSYAYPASISLFRNARGVPKILRSARFFTMTYISYDDADNCFLDGSRSPTGTDEYGEISRGKSKIRTVRLSKYLYPVQLQFADKRMAIGSLYRKIYRVKGRDVVGSSTFEGPIDSFFIAFDRVLTLNRAKQSRHYTVDVYKYPAGGKAISTITLQYMFGFDSPGPFVLTR